MFEYIRSSEIVRSSSVDTNVTNVARDIMQSVDKHWRRIALKCSLKQQFNRDVTHYTR